MTYWHLSFSNYARVTLTRIQHQFNGLVVESSCPLPRLLMPEYLNPQPQKAMIKHLIHLILFQRLEIYIQPLLCIGVTAIMEGGKPL